MITKEQFVSIMEKLKKQHDYDRNFTRLMGEAFPETHPPVYDNSRVMDAAIELMKLHFDGDDTVEWWIYETDFGEKDMYIIDNDQKFYFESAERLYDYLMKAQLQDKRLQLYIQQIKSGNHPTLLGVTLTQEIFDELMPYVKDEGYLNSLKSRVPKK